MDNPCKQCTPTEACPECEDLEKYVFARFFGMHEDVDPVEAAKNIRGLSPEPQGLAS